MKKQMLCIASHYLNEREFEASVRGNNVSTVIDKLIRLAAKNTDMYAGDISYVISRLDSDIEKKRSRVVLLGFCDDGVTNYDISDVVDCSCSALPQSNTLRMPACFADKKYEPLATRFQCWMLETYEADERKTYLRRVDVSFKDVSEDANKEESTKDAVKAILAEDSIKVGATVYTVARSLTMNTYGCAVESNVKNALTVLECIVTDIRFSMGENGTDVLLTLNTTEQISGVANVAYCRTLKDVAVGECFLFCDAAMREKAKRLNALNTEVRNDG